LPAPAYPFRKATIHTADATSHTLCVDDSRQRAEYDRLIPDALGEIRRWTVTGPRTSHEGWDTPLDAERDIANHSLMCRFCGDEGTPAEIAAHLDRHAKPTLVMWGGELEDVITPATIKNLQAGIESAYYSGDTPFQYVAWMFAEGAELEVRLARLEVVETNRYGDSASYRHALQDEQTLETVAVFVTSRRLDV
jgi:hypothetical protein